MNEEIDEVLDRLIENLRDSIADASAHAAQHSDKEMQKYLDRISAEFLAIDDFTQGMGLIDLSEIFEEPLH